MAIPHCHRQCFVPQQFLHHADIHVRHAEERRKGVTEIMETEIVYACAMNCPFEYLIDRGIGRSLRRRENVRTAVAPHLQLHQLRVECCVDWYYPYLVVLRLS